MDLATNYHYDARKIQKGDIFICLPKGQQYLKQAYANGAKSHIELTRPEFAQWSAEYYQHPSKKLTVIGITGTNGKTTVVFWLNQLLNLLGFHSIAQGTLTGSLTTPESWDTQKAMSKHLHNNGTHFIMEVSSHGIDQHRIDGIHFDVKLLTNLSQDHLDYHSNFETYKKTKLHFMNTFPGITLFPENYHYETIPSSVLKNYANHPTFYQDNLKAVIGLLKSLNITDFDSKLSNLKQPPGRFEILQENPFKVLIDFAHTPEAMELILKNCIQGQGRLITVFGCGGNRDRLKRSKMGAIAGEYSDYIVLTHDNPRYEDPSTIIQDIIQGMIPYPTPYQIISDRRKAIAHSLAYAEPGDIVTILGKGHEKGQIIGSITYPFDDREVTQSLLQSL